MFEKYIIPPKRLAQAEESETKIQEVLEEIRNKITKQLKNCEQENLKEAILNISKKISEAISEAGITPVTEDRVNALVETILKPYKEKVTKPKIPHNLKHAKPLPLQGNTEIITDWSRRMKDFRKQQESEKEES